MSLWFENMRLPIRSRASNIMKLLVSSPAAIVRPEISEPMIMTFFLEIIKLVVFIYVMQRLYVSLCKTTYRSSCKV